MNPLLTTGRNKVRGSIFSAAQGLEQSTVIHLQKIAMAGARQNVRTIFCSFSRRSFTIPCAVLELTPSAFANVPEVQYSVSERASNSARSFAPNIRTLPSIRCLYQAVVHWK